MSWWKSLVLLTVPPVAVTSALAPRPAPGPGGRTAPVATVLVLLGDWQGRIEAPGAPLTIGITLNADGTGTMDVAAQGITGLPLTDVRVDGARFTATVPDLPGGAAIDGTVAEDAASIAGDYTQAG